MKQDHHTSNVYLHYLVIYCYHYTCFRLSLFSDTSISQGSVAKLVRCGGIFNANFIANFLTSQPVKELWKSAYIWWSYRKSKKGDIFWDTVYKALPYPVNQNTEAIIRTQAAGACLHKCCSRGEQTLDNVMFTYDRQPLWGGGTDSKQWHQLL